jgi:hypothetical protein
VQNERRRFDPCGAPTRVIGDSEFETRSILERCVGLTFPVMGFNTQGMIQIDVGELAGKASYLESIWIERDCVQLANP